MKWRKLLTVVIASSTLLVTACSATGAGGKEAASNTGATAGSDTNSQELIVYSVDTKNQDLLQKMLKPFEDANKVHIKIVATESTKFMENFMAAHNGKQPIDLVDLNGQDVRFLATSGIIKDITDTVTFQDRFLKSALDPFTFNGKIYAVPLGSISTSALYYNKKLLEKYGLTPPHTYADVVNLANTLKKDKISAIGFGGATAYMWPMWFFQTFAQTSGNQSVERTFDTLRGKAKFTDPDYVAAMKALQQFGKDGLFEPGVNGIDRDAGQAIFSTGKSAMFYGGSWVYPDLVKAQAENKDQLDVGVVTFPLIGSTTEKPQATGGSGQALGIYSGISSAKESLARKLIDFWSSDAVQQQYLDGTKGTFSVNKNVKGALQDSVTKVLQEAYLPQTVTFLDWYWPPEITKAFQQNIQGVVGGQKTAEQAMSDIQKVFDDLVANGYSFDKKGS